MGCVESGAQKAQPQSPHTPVPASPTTPTDNGDGMPPAAPTPTYLPGPPIAVYMPPGQCVFGPEWTRAPLISKEFVSHDTRAFTFKLKEPDKPLGLSTCSCLLMKGTKGPYEAAGNPVVRPYTPVSTNDVLGEFVLLVKIYPNGKLTQHLEQLKVGQSMEFKHTPENVKIQWPFKKQQVCMVTGGTGIAPMIQALNCILGSDSDTSKVAMVYGSKTHNDILEKQTLEKWEEMHGDRFTLTNVLSHEPQDSQWAGERGFISKELITAKFPPPSSDCIIFVCGPPALYSIICGPRDKPELTGILAELGYQAEQVVKF